MERIRDEKQKWLNLKSDDGCVFTVCSKKKMGGMWSADGRGLLKRYKSLPKLIDKRAKT